MTKSIHCAQPWAKSHSANYSSLTRNEHISQSASIRCSLWTNSNTLQPNPAPSEKKLKQVIPRREGGGVQKQRDAGKKKEPVDTFNETTKTGEDKERETEEKTKNNSPNQKRQTQKAIQFVMNKYTKVRQMKGSLWLVVVRPCEEWRSSWVRERDRERCICYMSQ